MGKWQHHLTEVNEETDRATCAKCGPVGLYWKNVGNGVKRPRCRVARREQRGSRKGSHGLTVEQAREYREGKACVICDSTDRLHVDHDHGSGKIRGVLCHGCNVGLGFFNDSPERLVRAAAYLRAAEGPAT